ncbi:MAG: insulinase family protein [Bacteroidia bacterium]|nr:insulinase family protein [Bacteroidia bacterium]MDW8332662.1 insulinase family protein [Bacteroidia bacterium]
MRNKTSILTAALTAAIVVAAAQAQDLKAPIPLAPEVKYGALPNGMKYYVQRNAKPEKRAELRLILNAGSVLEDDDQQGLAHFVEHMCFNGTESFPGNEIDDYLESVGVKFGPHLNAYTSFDETVYMIRVPTDKPEVLAKGLKILEEWAHKVTFEPKEIEKERGVVIEEWRLRLGADNRLREKTLPVLLNNSRHSQRLPIGKKEVLESFNRETLIRYYKDWYRPDLMAVAIVGDIEPNQMVESVKAIFGKIPAAKNPKTRTEYYVEGHREARAVVATDPEARFTALSFLYKKNRRSFSTVSDFRRRLIEILFTEMLNNRLSEYVNKENPPFMFCYTYVGGFIRNMEAFGGYAYVTEGNVLRALETMIVENRRVVQHGFTSSELDRAKADLLKKYEQAFLEKDKTESENVVERYVAHFLSQKPAPGPEFEYRAAKDLLPGISLDEVHAAAKEWITEDNFVVSLTGPEKIKETLPDEKALLNAYAAAKNKPVAPYQDSDLSKPIINGDPKPGKVVREKTLKEIGALEWTLENGAKVVLKPTDFKNDEILFAAHSPGGYSLYDKDEIFEAKVCAEVIEQSGVGNYKPSDLEKKLAGKEIVIGVEVEEMKETMSGSCTPDDFETMLQIVYGMFTQPRKDVEAFKAWQSKTISWIANKASSPDAVFNDTVTAVMSGYHPHAAPLTIEQVESFELKKIFEIYTQRFANADDFTFVFVGKFEPNTVKPLIEKYIGGLPSTGRVESGKDHYIRPPEGKTYRKIFKGKDDQSRVYVNFHGKFVWDGHERMKLKALQDVLNIMLRESMREEKGGVYGVRCYAVPHRDPYPHYKITIVFGCAPANVETLLNTMHNDVKTLIEQGPSEKNMTKIREIFKREIETNLQENDFWLNKLDAAYWYGLDPNEIPMQYAAFEKVTAEEIQQAAKLWLGEGNYVQIVRYPEKP